MAVTVRGLPSRVEDAVRRTLAGAELPVVVAGAGLQARASFLELEQGEWLAAVDAVRHAFLAARQAAAAWLEAGTPGRIIFVVSAASVRTLQGSALDATAGGFLTTHRPGRRRRARRQGHHGERRCPRLARGGAG